MLRAGFHAVFVVIGIACLPISGAAQEFSVSSSPILIVDQERMFDGSKVGEAIRSQIEALSEELTGENRVIEEQLIAEELEITERRPALTPAEFQEIANAFDEKVQGIRIAQDAKILELQRIQDAQRQNFLRQISPILTEIVRERGAVVVLDRRSVFLSSQSVDITDEAIARIDSAFDALESDPVPIEALPDPGDEVTPVQP